MPTALAVRKHVRRSPQRTRTVTPEPQAPVVARRSSALKRGFDLLAALALLVPAVPLILLSMLAVRLTSRGPAVYLQTRLGRHGRPFRIVKIRTMYHNCEKASGARWSTPGDRRITPVGRFLRKTHLDELPQLWNVIRGDMSLVGPRPERPEFVPYLEQAIPGYRERLEVCPGVTGLAQVMLPADTDLHSVRRKLVYDRHYVRQGSLGLDLRLILCTGLSLVGVPFSSSSRWLRIPCLAEAAAMPRMDQPALIPLAQTA